MEKPAETLIEVNLPILPLLVISYLLITVEFIESYAYIYQIRLS